MGRRGYIGRERNGIYLLLLCLEFGLVVWVYPLPFFHVPLATLFSLPRPVVSAPPKRLVACSARPVPTTEWWSSPPREA